MGVRIPSWTRRKGRTITPKNRYLDSELTEAIAASFSLAQTVRVLGMGRSGSASAHVKKRALGLELDMSHFTGGGWSAGLQARNKKSPEALLVDHSDHPIRTEGARLTKALLELGRAFECVGCGNTGFWLGKNLRLHVDHINGNPYDDRMDNLRFLCPNCHDQTDTFGKRKKK